MFTKQKLLDLCRSQLKYVRKMRLDFQYDQKKKKTMSKQQARKYSGRFNYKDIKQRLQILDDTIKSARKDKLLSDTDYIRLIRSYNKTILGTKYIEDIEKLIKTWTRFFNAVSKLHDVKQEKS